MGQTKIALKGPDEACLYEKEEEEGERERREEKIEKERCGIFAECNMEKNKFYCRIQSRGRI